MVRVIELTMEKIFEFPLYESTKVEIMNDPLIGEIYYENVVRFWSKYLEHIDPRFRKWPTLLACEASNTRSYRGWQIFNLDHLPVAVRTANLSPNHPVGSFTFHALSSLLGGARVENGLVVLRDFEKGFKNLVVFFSRRTSGPHELNDFIFNPLRDFANRIGQPLHLTIDLVDGTEGATIFTYRQLVEGKFKRKQIAEDIRENLV